MLMLFMRTLSQHLQHCSAMLTLRVHLLGCLALVQFLYLNTNPTQSSDEEIATMRR